MHYARNSLLVGDLNNTTGHKGCPPNNKPYFQLVLKRRDTKPHPARPGRGGTRMQGSASCTRGGKNGQPHDACGLNARGQARHPSAPAWCFRCPPPMYSPFFSTRSSPVFFFPRTGQRRNRGPRQCLLLLRPPPLLHVAVLHLGSRHSQPPRLFVSKRCSPPGVGAKGGGGFRVLQKTNTIFPVNAVEEKEEQETPSSPSSVSSCIETAGNKPRK